MTDREKTIKNLESIVELCKIKQMDCKIGYVSREMFADFARDISDAIALLKEQDSMIEDARSQGWSEGYDECEREYQENM